MMPEAEYQALRADCIKRIKLAYELWWLNGQAGECPIAFDENETPAPPERTMSEKKARKPNKALTNLIANTGKSEAECRAMLGMSPPPARLAGKRLTIALEDDVLAKVDALAAKQRITRPAAIVGVLVEWAKKA